MQRQDDTSTKVPGQSFSQILRRSLPGLDAQATVASHNKPINTLLIIAAIQEGLSNIALDPFPSSHTSL